jgi:hypothetical protein
LRRFPIRGSRENVCTCYPRGRDDGLLEKFTA